MSPTLMITLLLGERDRVIRDSGAGTKPRALVEPLNSGARARILIELGSSVCIGRNSEF